MPCEDGSCCLRQNYKAHGISVLRVTPIYSVSFPSALSGILTEVWSKKDPYHTRITG